MVLFFSLVCASQTRDCACGCSGTQHTNVSGRLCHGIYYLFVEKKTRTSIEFQKLMV